MPYDINGYLDPLHIVWRNGTADDPYKDRVEYIVVANQTVILSEIPDKVFRVRIVGMREISYEKMTTSKIAENEFYVNYSTGVIQFHESAETKTLTITYKGRGFIQYPSDRIYHRDKINNVVTSLSLIIDGSNRKISEIDERIIDIKKAIESAEIATANTNKATDNTNRAIEDAEIATDKALDAYRTTRMVFKPFVQKYEDIAKTYPLPEVGWTTQVYETGIRYRWDGIDWVAIEGFGGSIPKASEVMDGIMSKEHFSKLEDISENVDVRTIVFVCPQDVYTGVQDPFIKFPHDGEITEIDAYVTTTGTFPLSVDIETSDDFVTWNKLTTSPVLINANSHLDSKTHTLSETEVSKGTFFRLNVPSTNIDAMGLHLNINIKIN